jgi:hypothetical protein
MRHPGYAVYCQLLHFHDMHNMFQIVIGRQPIARYL